MSQFFSSTRGGGEFLFYIMAKKLAENNHKIWIITNKIMGEKYSEHENIELIFVPPILKYHGGLPASIKDNIQYLLNTVRVGLKIIKENNVEIIHSNNFTPALTGSILSFLTFKVHITSVWDIFTLCGCDYWKRWVEQTGISKFNQFIGPIFEKVILKTKCNAFHTISKTSKDDLIKFGAKKPIYMFPPTIEETEDKKIVKNNKQFIFVGRLVFYKNIEVIVKATNIVKKHIPDIKLMVIGGGPQFNMIEKRILELHIEKNIIFKGYVSSQEKTRLISESNAMLFPSLCEGFGLVILEAFAQGKPVLVSDVEPMSKIIQHENTGFVIDPHDEKAWSEYITRLIKNPQESKKMGMQGKKTLKEKYNQEKFYQNIINMYKSIKKHHIC